jgi:AcrR family transcriptional regulator
MAAKAPPARASRESWAQAALEALTESGVEAVAVEPVARRLGVTKGSFYWHFQNRAELLEAALALWERRSTSEVIAELDGVPDPAERLRRLFRYVAIASKNAVPHAVLSSASDPAVATVLARVATARLEFLTRCYAELGMAPALARRRAVLAYAAYLGMLQLTRDAPALRPVGAERDAYTEHLIETLVPAAPAAGSRRAKGTRRPAGA